MTAPVPQCQPTTNELRSISQSTRDGRCLEFWFSRNVTHDDREDIRIAIETHTTLKARAEQAERAVDVLESNAREQAKLLADTGRRVEELEKLGKYAQHHIGCYVNDKLKRTCNCGLNDLRAALSSGESGK